MCVCVCVCVCAAQSLNPTIVFAIIHHFYSSICTAAMYLDSTPRGLAFLSARVCVCVCVRVRAKGIHSIMPKL